MGIYKVLRLPLVLSLLCGLLAFYYSGTITPPAEPIGSLEPTDTKDMKVIMTGATGAGTFLSPYLVRDSFSC